MQSWILSVSRVELHLKAVTCTCIICIWRAVAQRGAITESGDRDASSSACSICNYVLFASARAYYIVISHGFCALAAWKHLRFHPIQLITCVEQHVVHYFTLRVTDIFPVQLVASVLAAVTKSKHTILTFLACAAFCVTALKCRARGAWRNVACIVTLN